MIRVFISYSRTESVTFSFWNHFFQSCGIWVTEKIINKDTVLPSKDPHLIILSNEDISRVSEQTVPRHIYLVKKNSGSRQLLKTRQQDVFGLKRWSKDGICVFSQIIPQLLSGLEEADEISKLMEVYIRVRLWEYTWLFHEIAFRQESVFDKEILKICSIMLNELEQLGRWKGKWNYEFMKLYCQYMRYWVKNRGLVERMDICERLLFSCRILADKDWYPSLSRLTGKICELSPTERKYAVYYYKNALSYDKCAQLLYDVGHFYEKIQGDNEKAISYYKDACKYNPDYYRAQYKMAVFLEERGKWMEAVKIYYKIKKQLSIGELINSISVSDIEYYYKCCIRILRIYQVEMSDRETVAKYEKEVSGIHVNIINSTIFDKLISCMSGKEKLEQRRMEILKEVESRIVMNS